MKMGVDDRIEVEVGPCLLTLCRSHTEDGLIRATLSASGADIQRISVTEPHVYVLGLRETHGGEFNPPRVNIGDSTIYLSQNSARRIHNWIHPRYRCSFTVTGVLATAPAPEAGA